ncbi:MAG: hypothetical protein GEU81_08755 [Nitriliruptorales bacterium]|nr:hypothetical protein [Nitriliruptorales bacterium]
MSDTGTARSAASGHEVIAGCPVVEGHRDCYEQIYRLNLGEDDPIADRIAARLAGAGVNAVFYAIGGDTIAHSDGRDRPLFATLRNLHEFDRSAHASGAFYPIEHAGQLGDLNRDGRVGFILHLEGGMPLEGDVASLWALFRLGVRSLQPTWNLRNELGDGVHERGTGGGLSRFGREVVVAAEGLGMVVDLAHIAEAGFWSAMELGSNPKVVSHANARSVYDHPRNLSDAQIRAVAESGGVVGAHFLPAYVDPEHTTIDRVIDHIGFMCELVGSRHVALGPDFPTSDGPRPAREQRFSRKKDHLDGVEEISELPKVVDRMLERGFTQKDVEAILGGNFVRVLGGVPARRPGALTRASTALPQRDHGHELAAEAGRQSVPSQVRAAPRCDLHCWYRGRKREERMSTPVTVAVSVPVDYDRASAVLRSDVLCWLPAIAGHKAGWTAAVRRGLLHVRVEATVGPRGSPTGGAWPRGLALDPRAGDRLGWSRGVGGPLPVVRPL